MIKTPGKERMTIEKLAIMIAGGFNEVHEKMDAGFTNLQEQINEINSTMPLLATKKDLENYITKEDAGQFSTKSDLSHLTTKIAHLATKEDLRQLEIRTAVRFSNIENRLDRLENRIFPRQPWQT